MTARFQAEALAVGKGAESQPGSSSLAPTEPASPLQEAHLSLGHLSKADVSLGHRFMAHLSLGDTSPWGTSPWDISPWGTPLALRGRVPVEAGTSTRPACAPLRSCSACPGPVRAPSRHRGPPG